MTHWEWDFLWVKNPYRKYHLHVLVLNSPFSLIVCMPNNLLRVFSDMYSNSPFPAGYFQLHLAGGRGECICNFGDIYRICWSISRTLYFCGENFDFNF